MGRCTRLFLLIINVLYRQKCKSAPPSIKSFAKKCICNPDIAKWAFAFLELNAKHVQVNNNALKKKIFYITLQLVTLNAASHCVSLGYSGDSFQNTRHPLITPKPCILLRMWDIEGWFTRHPLITFFRVTSELAMQLVLYQNDIPLNGDEWVTSETKWITAATHWHIKPYNAMGDELQSYVKILFFDVNSTLPLLQVPSNSLANPM